MHSDRNKEKIFISIASYRDPELIPTILDCVKKAQNKYRLHFGLCIQDEKSMVYKIKKIKKQYGIKIRYVFCHWRESQGACWARYLIQRKLYKGEKFYFQLDSHHRFLEQWDSVLIDMNNNLKKEYPKNIIGGYCPGYRIPKNVCDPDPIRISSFDTFGEDGDLVFRPHVVREKLSESVFPARFLSGHFIFAEGRFVRECMYDPNMYFRGEEITLSARAYTFGYKLFHPSFPIVWHYYIRQEADKHWLNHTTKNGYIIDCDTREKQAKNRLRTLLGMQPTKIKFGSYGLGKIRTLADYERYAGLNFFKKQIHKHTANIRNDSPFAYEMSDAELENMLINKLVRVKIPENMYNIDSRDMKAIILCIYDHKDRLLFRDDLKPYQITQLFRSHQWQKKVGLESTPRYSTLTIINNKDHFSKPIKINNVEHYDSK